MPWTSTEHIEFRNLVANWHLVNKGKAFDHVVVRKQLPTIPDAEYKKYLKSAWHFVNAEYPRWLVKILQAEQQAEKRKKSPPQMKAPEQVAKEEEEKGHRAKRQRVVDVEKTGIDEAELATDRALRLAPDDGIPEPLGATQLSESPVLEEETSAGPDAALPPTLRRNPNHQKRPNTYINAGAGARSPLPMEVPQARKNRLPGDFWCAKCLGWRDRESYANDKKRCQQICLFHGMAFDESSQRAREGPWATRIIRSHN